MIEMIEFGNFKVLRSAKLPLGPCTVLVGANGSGKSTVLQALENLTGRSSFSPSDASLGNKPGKFDVEVRLHWSEPIKGVVTRHGWFRSGPTFSRLDDTAKDAQRIPERFLPGIRVFSLDAAAIAAPVAVKQGVELGQNGQGLSGVLTGIQDSEPERFEALNDELGRWLPEFDRILFDFDANGRRLLFLRTREGHFKIPAQDVSQGTLLALAILTLAYLPEPPSLVGLEEPDRGIHPRLLRRIQDAIYRLAYPESCGENREPVQVLATTHSPYFLDLFKDHPEEIVIAERVDANVQFQRLSDRPDIQDILADSPLGEIWFSGILGGVPTAS